MSEHTEEHIAIVGMAGRFPGAPDIGTYWQNLAAGREAVRFPSDAELLEAGVPPEQLADSGYVKAVAEASDVESFDAEFFGFTPRDAAALDPQIRMFLEVAHSAIENAGYDPHRVADGMGVYATAGANRYLDMHVRAGGYEPSSTGGLALSTLSYPDYVATHMAYRFGFRGPALTVSTACSSSAVAVHLACQALRTGECDVALAGGAEMEVPVHHGYLWDPGGPMSADGHCRPFDAAATGTVFSSGGAAVLLKRLADAVADGDHVWAVIRASAMNNDGAAKAGFSAPGIAGQVAVIREAMSLAEATPTDISYVEAHATGTALGDPIEVAALAKAYRGAGPAPTDPIPLSSVKGNIGHLGHAAGVASLVKVALCLTHEQRVATVNFSTPNPRIRLSDTPFDVTAAAMPWPRTPDRPRIAGLSSLGIGGTNVHLVVQEAPARAPAAGSARRPEVVLWSALTEPALAAAGQTLADRLRSVTDEDFPSAVDTLQDGRTPHPRRAAVVAADGAEAAETMTAGRVLRSGTAGQARPVVLLFPGQAAQYPRMAAELYGVDQTFTRAVDTCLDQFREHGHDLREDWLSGAELTDTSMAQPLLFAVQYALARMWLGWGVEPAVVLGHSLGELAAAAVAGVFTLPDAVRVVAARAQAMAELPTGAMLAVATDPQTLDRALPDGLPGAVVVAVVNGPRQTVLSGPSDQILAVAEGLRRHGVAGQVLATSHAFHSPAMAPARDRVADVLRGVTLHEPTIPMLSASTGGPVGEAAVDPAFWSEQVTGQVRFDRVLDHLLATPHLLVEVGPGRALTGLARRHPAAGASVAVAALGHGGGDGKHVHEHRGVLTAAATVWLEGHSVDWAAVRPARPPRRIPLPGYQYQRSRHWLPLRTGSGPATAGQAPAPAPQLPDVSAFSTRSWVEQPRPPAAPGQGGVAVAILPVDTEASLPAVLALQQAGYRLQIARPGPEFRLVDGEYRLRSDLDADLDRLLDEVTDRTGPPVLLAHGLALAAWAPPTVAGVEEQVTVAFHTLAALVRAAARRTGIQRLSVLASRSADVTGAEPVEPVKAALHGALRSVALELPGLDCRLVDVADQASWQVAELAAELAVGSGPPVVALRGPGRWVPVERPYRPDPAPSPLRRDGVYLLTGGLGGLGMAVARELAATGLRPHLVLTGRTGLPPDGDAVRLRAEVAALESLGARVRVEACDVADRRATRRLLDRIRAHVGVLHGVVHLAGTPGGGILARRTRADSEAVLRPKVLGTVVLAELLAEHPPVDFFVAFSSRAAPNGMAGSADYAAANAFQDAFARTLARSGVPALSINWPAWRDVGMAARMPDSGAGRPAPAGTAGGERRWVTELRVEDHPVLDEHRVSGVPVLPGTGHVDAVVTAFRETVGPPGTPLTFTEVVFQRVLDGSRPRRLTVLLRPDGDEWSFQTSSVPVDGAGPAVVHVAGTVRGGAEPAAEPADLDLLRKRLPTPVPSDPTDGATHLFRLGPRWRESLHRLTTGTDAPGELLMEVALPPPYHDDLARHPSHPALLDLATAEVRDPLRDSPHLPFRYGSLSLYEDLPARFTSHIRRRHDRSDSSGLIVADIDLYGEDGRPLVSLSGFTMRTASLDGVLGATTTSGDGGAEGLDPAEGARLFRQLLEARHPFQVAVRPFRDGRPVPLDDVAVTAGAGDPPRHVAGGATPAITATAESAPDPGAATPPAPRNVDERLSRLWTRVLGVVDVGPDDEFFELGGNSLSVVELMGLVQEEFGVRMSVVAMFDHPTLSGFARALIEQGAR
jgi:phthiocerol/phenolphthiocerol synthesis type-I polyketide synthase E